MNEAAPAVHSVILQAEGRWWRFNNPIRTISAETPADVLPALAAVEQAVEQDGLFAAGAIAYEAAAALGLTTQPARAGLPLVWFGLYEWREPIEPPSSDGSYAFHNWQPAIDANNYAKAIDTIKRHIARGDTYQVNYTFPVRAQFEGDAWALFCELARAQQAQHCAYLDLGRFAIASASPELFFDRNGTQLTSRPMKGTAPRGRTLAEDEANSRWLAQSQKNRAENVMIVDMIRNDMGRVARVGSVSVPSLFDVERYPTVLQMTSTVSAKTDVPLLDLLQSMFPCASITGAPKVRTMEIIRELEPEPRGIYTGAIGMLAPGRRASFNVAIRTVTIDRNSAEALYNVGSGIVWDSDAAEEYEECRVKTRVLMSPRPSFELLDALLWTPDGYFLRPYHVKRLLDSARYFGIDLGREAVDAALDQLAETLSVPSKVRLLVDDLGRVRSQASSLANGAMVEPVRVGLAAEPVDASTVWLYHKTSVRHVYDQARASRPDCDDVLLWNTDGELTEAGSANVVVRLDGKLLTPPVDSGLLAGTMRQHLLDVGLIAERRLTVEDLCRSDAIYLINSVRQWRRATFIAKPNT